MEAAFARLRDALRAGTPVAFATVVELAGREGDAGDAAVPRLGAKLLVGLDGEPTGSLGDADLDRLVARDALAQLVTGERATRHYGGNAPGGGRGTTGTAPEITVFIDVFAPPRRLVVLGAVDFTAALVRVAKVLGYRVTVCDARPVFATRARFPEADEVVADWPHRYLARIADELGPQDALCVLTHDHKFDVPAIMAGLSTRVGYIGAMGSRRTHDDRLARLRAEGVSEEQLERMMAPIGIDLGARTPEETAVSICAEIIATQTGTPASSLRYGSGPIHRVPVG